MMLKLIWIEHGRPAGVVAGTLAGAIELLGMSSSIAELPDLPELPELPDGAPMHDSLRARRAAVGRRSSAQRATVAQGLQLLLQRC